MLNMKLKERLALALSAGVVLFTLMLIVDLQMDYGISGHRVPLHGRVKIGDEVDKGRSTYLEFRKRFLQKRFIKPPITPLTSLKTAILRRQLAPTA